MLTELISAIQLGREAFSFTKDLIKETVPESQQKRIAMEKVEEAEKALKLAEAKVAQELKYHLCRCTFPPQIMLDISQRGSDPLFECPRCKRTEHMGHGPDAFIPENY